MKNLLYTIITITTLLLTGCADASKNQSVTANTKVYFDISKVKTDLGGEITQYNWELTGSAASLYNIYIFNNGTDHASFIAPDVKEETKLTFKLTSIESYKCSTSDDSSCKHHKSVDKVKITVTPAKDSNSTNNNSSNTSGSITLSGKIKTLNNVALSGAIVTVNGKTVTTRNDGTYKINNLKTDERAIINVTHPDYFDNTRVVLVNQSGSYAQDINLDKGHLALSFDAQEGRNVTDNQASINFEPGEYIDTKGKKYTDNVSVTMSYYNFKKSTDNRAFIGSYETTDGTTQSALLPYSFINMSISDATGNALKIDSDTVVKLAFPTADIDSNEATIPLWFYNKKMAYWLQEGKATRVNNQYIAQVTRAEAWGLFSKTSKGSIQVCVVDGDNKAIAAANIRMKGDRWTSNLIQTDTEGFAVINTVRSDVQLTITASKLIGNEQISANYSTSVTLSAGDNINLSDCIVLKSKKIVPSPSPSQSPSPSP
jgi:hypothetical protein